MLERKAIYQNSKFSSQETRLKKYIKEIPKEIRAEINKIESKYTYGKLTKVKKDDSLKTDFKIDKIQERLIKGKKKNVTC